MVAASAATGPRCRRVSCTACCARCSRHPRLTFDTRNMGCSPRFDLALKRQNQSVHSG
jgi:hypothetical protein